MAKAITSNKILVEEAWIAFTDALGKAKGFRKDDGTESTPKYGATLLLDPTNAKHAAIIAKIKSEAGRIAKEFFTDGIPKSFSHPGTKDLCYGLGDDLDKVYNGFQGMFYFKGSSNDRIPVVGRRRGANGKFVLVQPGDAEWPFAGCIVNAEISMWTQNSHGRKAINGNLNTVQFVRKDKNFGGGAGADPEAVFKAYEDNDAVENDPFA